MSTNRHKSTLAGGFKIALREITTPCEDMGQEPVSGSTVHSWMKRPIVLLGVCLYHERDCCDINGFIRRFPLFCLYERLSLGGSFAEPPSSKETLDVYRIISIDHAVSRRQRRHRRPLGHLFKMPDRESPFSCRDCHGVNSHGDGGGGGGGLCLKRGK